MRLRRRSVVASVTVVAILAAVSVAVLSGGEEKPIERRVVPTAYGDVQLDGPGQDAVRTLVDGYVKLLVEELADVAQTEPFAAIALMAGQEGLDVTPNVALATQGDLDSLFQQDPKFGAFYVWNAWEYSDSVELASDQPPADMIRAWETLRNNLDGKVLDPVLWTLNRVRFKLNRMKLPVTTTEDATVFVFEDDGDQIDGLEFSTTSDVLARLRKRGYASR